MALPRRRIEELVTLYHLRPCRRDVYTEGVFSRDLANWFLTEAGVSDAVVYDIDAVEIENPNHTPSEQVSGAKERVLYLAEILEQHLGSGCCQATCIVDADFDRVLDRLPVCSLVLVTDFACTRAYLFDISVLDKFLRLTVGGNHVKIADVMLQFSPILRTSFIIRLAKANLFPDVHWIPIKHSCTFDNGQVVFDAKDYISRLFNMGHTDKQTRLLQNVLDWDRRLTGEARHYVHGHDFVDLLGWFLHRTRAAGWLRETCAVERSLLGCVSYEYLTTQPLFVSLLRRVTA